MSEDINTWKVSRDDSVLAQVLKFIPGVEQAKVTSKALDGSVYIQTIGSGIKYANVLIFATSEEITNINVAEADGALISIVYRDTQYLGYIEKAPEWTDDMPGEYYTATFKLLIEEEVSL